jgi:hypothetical protein
MSDYRIRVLGGLPAIARVTSFYPYVPATWDSPSEGGEVEFEILDQRGRPAAWLERRLTDKDRADIDGEVYARCVDDYRNRADIY